MVKQRPVTLLSSVIDLLSSNYDHSGDYERLSELVYLEWTASYLQLFECKFLLGPSVQMRELTVNPCVVPKMQLQKVCTA